MAEAQRGTGWPGLAQLLRNVVSGTFKGASGQLQGRYEATGVLSKMSHSSKDVAIILALIVRFEQRKMCGFGEAAN